VHFNFFVENFSATDEINKNNLLIAVGSMFSILLSKYRLLYSQLYNYLFIIYPTV